MQLEKNNLICGETVVHQIWEKKWKISYMWEFLIFFFTYVPYTINYPLLYSLTSIIPLKCMEFHFSLSVTITDFFLPRHSKQMLSLTQKNLPKVKISPKVFWAYLYIYQCFFTVLLRAHGFMRTLWAWIWSDQPRIRIAFLGTEVKRKPAAHQWWILVLFPGGGRRFASPGYLSWSILT